MNAVAKTETPQVPQVAQSESAAIISMIERMASDPSIDIARLEKILELRERVETRNAKMAYAAAMSAMQPNLPTIERNGRIKIAIKADREKPEHEQRLQQSTPYALWEDISEAIRPVLADHGFALSFRTGTTQDNKITVTGILSHREGHQEETTMILTHDSSGSKNAVQAIGSSLSYGRRYTAMLLLNITSRALAECDDDGQAAGDPERIGADDAAYVRSLLAETKSDEAKFLQVIKATSVDTINAEQFKRAIDLLNRKKAKGTHQ